MLLLSCKFGNQPKEPEVELINLIVVNQITDTANWGNYLWLVEAQL